MGFVNVAIWKLPSGFIETCHRHLKEGTVGETTHCNQLIHEEPATASSDRRPCCYDQVDHFGILRCRFDGKNPQVMQLTILNSIISEDDNV